MAGKIYGVSLGPGDPELITVKGLRVLQQADKIYYPGSVLADGSHQSYSLSILQHYNLDKTKLYGMFLSMSHDRTEALQGYQQTFEQMKADYDRGLTVAFVSEGDISFYSTFAYLLAPIQTHQLAVEIIAGVPSFLLAAACHQQPLATLREKIAIVPLLESSEALVNYLHEFETLVLIKVRGAMAYIQPLLEAKKATLLYAEKLGTPQQFLTDNLRELDDRQLPYFSLLILKSQLCN